VCSSEALQIVRATAAGHSEVGVISIGTHDAVAEQVFKSTAVCWSTTRRGAAGSSRWVFCPETVSLSWGRSVRSVEACRLPT
jgi:hypothetical protein